VTNEVVIYAQDRDLIIVNGWTSGINFEVSTSHRVNSRVYQSGGLGGANDLDASKWNRWFDKSGTYKVRYRYQNVASAGIVDIGFDVSGATDIFNQLDTAVGTSIDNIETTVEVARGYHDIHIKVNGTNGTDFQTYTVFFQFDLINEHPVLGESATAKFGEREVLERAITGETESLTTGTGVVEWQMPFDFVIEEIYATVGTAPTGSTATFDINDDGTSILIPLVQPLTIIRSRSCA